MLNVSGSCLCESIKFSFDTKKKEFDVCHCGMCRKWNGGPAMTIEVSNNHKLEGEEFLGTYSSSEWAERGFCKKCGTNLFYRLKNHDYLNYNLGVIDNSDEFTFESQIFIDSKPDNYSFSNKTKMMTEEEVLKLFS